MGRHGVGNLPKGLMVVGMKTSAQPGRVPRTADAVALAHQLSPNLVAPEDAPAPFGDEPMSCPYCGLETVLTEYVSGLRRVGRVLPCDRRSSRFHQGDPATLGAAA
jgi:hypothetical protein